MKGGGRYCLSSIAMAFATTGSHRARAQSAAPDGARFRNRTVRVHVIIATGRPPFLNSRGTLHIFIPPYGQKIPHGRHRGRDMLIRSHDRWSASTKNSMNKKMHQNNWSRAIKMVPFLGGHSLMIAVIEPSPVRSGVRFHMDEGRMA